MISSSPLNISICVALKSSSLSACATISQNLRPMVASMGSSNWLWMIGEGVVFTFATQNWLKVSRIVSTFIPLSSPPSLPTSSTWPSFEKQTLA